ncbi:hypothetical protein HOY80DRAFT_859034, partial [Tuber brumale]
GQIRGGNGVPKLAPEEILEYAHTVAGEENIRQTPVRAMTLPSLDTCQLYKDFAARYAHSTLFVGPLEISSEHLDYSEGKKNRVREY